MTIKNVCRHCQMSPGGQKSSLVEDMQVYSEHTIALFFSEVLGRGEGGGDPEDGEAKCLQMGWAEGSEGR